MDSSRPGESGTLTVVRQAHLTLVTGLPGTGKSTLARALAVRYRVPILCKDTIKEPLLDILGASDPGESRKLSNASFAILFALARDVLGAGSDLILEGNFRPGEHEPVLQALILQSARTQSAPAAHAQAAGAQPAPLSDERLTQAGDPHRAQRSDERLAQVSAAQAARASDAHLAQPAATHPAQPALNVRLTQILCRASEPIRLARLKARATDPTRHTGHRDADLTAAMSPAPLDFLALPGERLVFDSDARTTAEVDASRLRQLLDTLDHWQALAANWHGLSAKEP